MLTISVMTLNKIINIMALIEPFATASGRIPIIRTIFIISSVTLLFHAVSMFSLPCKNPLLMLDMVMNGMMMAIDISAFHNSSL